MTVALKLPTAPLLGDLLHGLVDPGEVGALTVAGLCLDSRNLRPGELFLAVAGHRQHGMSHTDQAAARGAVAVVYDPAAGGEALAVAFGKRLPCIPLPDLHTRLGLLADRFYRQPSRRLAVVGITGTNGKTSCTHYVAQALGPATPCAVMGTLGWGLPGRLVPTANTTPDALAIHAAMAELVEQGVAALAMEVSSHGLAQGRTACIHFAGAVFTNWSRDHLDYHGDMDAYLAAKLKLLEADGLRFVVTNVDDASFSRVAAAAPARARLIPYSAKARALHGVEVLRALDIRRGAGGLAFAVNYGGEVAAVNAPLFGLFNVDNLLAALGALLGLGYGLNEAAARLSAVRAVPGRMERFAVADGPVAVVDYAHTPHALESVLHSLRGHCTGRLWCVFGCGGDRDRGKRAEMGRIAADLADRVVVTDDNPRREDGNAIVASILSGCPGVAHVTVQRDRRAAIVETLAQARAGDVVLVAGKGHESYQEIGDLRLPFSDREIVAQWCGGGVP